MKFDSGPQGAPDGQAQHGNSLPPARMAYWKPALALEGLISGYHLYTVTPVHDGEHEDVFQPAWFNLRVLLDPATQWHVRCGTPLPVRVPDVSLFGPSSAACWSQSEAGTVIGAGITPQGWARLSTRSASSLANRVLPAREVLGPAVAVLAAGLRANPTEDAIPACFDRWFLAHMAPPGRDDDKIARLTAALLDPATRSVGTLVACTGMPQRSLERLSRHAFGFSAKLLLRRARFLRSLHALIGGGPGRHALAIDAGYTDYSHFIREAHEFLGMKPTQFLDACGPMFRQSLRLRTSVLGSPAQALGSRALSSPEG